MSSRDFFKDATTRHSIFLQRFAGGRTKELNEYLVQMRKDITKILERDDIPTLSRARLRNLLADVNQTAKAGFLALSEDFKKQLTEFAQYEAEFGTAMLGRGTSAEFTTPSLKAIQSALATRFIKPALGTRFSLESLVATYISAKRKEIIKVIRSGVSQGSTTEEIVSDVSKRMRHTQKRHLRTLVSTAVNSVSTMTRELTFKENSDIVESVEWVSTLDSRTSATCRSLDGKKFPINSGPRPPQHWACRSTVIPVVKKEYNLAIPKKRPGIGDDGPELISGQSTYNSWLKKQSKEFQIEVLGPTKAKLFRDGGLSMDKFVDKNYQELTLAQLKRKQPLAFEKAGIE